MGQRIDPRILRLGTSVKWKLKLREDLVTNIFINRLLKWLMFSETTSFDQYELWPSFESIEEDEDDTDMWKLFRDSYYMHLPWNSFKYLGFIYSHSNFSIFNNNIYLAIFYFDTIAENVRIISGLRFNFFYFLTGNKRKKHYNFAKKALTERIPFIGKETILKHKIKNLNNKILFKRSNRIINKKTTKGFIVNNITVSQFSILKKNLKNVNRKPRYVNYVTNKSYINKYKRLYLYQKLKIIRHKNRRKIYKYNRRMLAMLALKEKIKNFKNRLKRKIRAPLNKRNRFKIFSLKKRFKKRLCKKAGISQKKTYKLKKKKKYKKKKWT